MAMLALRTDQACCRSQPASRQASLEGPRFDPELAQTGLKAENTGLWPRTPSKTCLCPGTAKKPVNRASLVPGSCPNVFPFSVPGGGGVRGKLSLGTLASSLKFRSVLWHPNVLFGDSSSAPKLYFRRPGRPTGAKMGGKIKVRISKNRFSIE